MTKAVFSVRVQSNYDDLPEVRYHFPKTYRRYVERVVGDWIVYYEPSRTSSDGTRRGGRQAYFATAKLKSVRRDPLRDDHFYAYVSDYLEFDQTVPFRADGNYYESGLQREDGYQNKGAFRRAVRLIQDHEYTNILWSGFNQFILQNRQIEAEQKLKSIDEPEVYNRRLIQRVESRPFRDAAFSKQVKVAYKDTCSVTGLKLINGGGLSEVQAAHIRPVSHQGPDSVRNGIALSGTVHWMFDRGLISIDDDYAVLVKEDSIPNPILSMLNQDRHLHLPDSPALAPHPKFLEYHRETIFKG